MLDLQKAKRAAEEYVSVSKSMTVTLRRADIGLFKEVKPSQTKETIPQPKTEILSPRERLTKYLQSIGQQ